MSPRRNARCASRLQTGGDRSGVGELRVGVSRGGDVPELEARVADHCQRIELAGVRREGRLRLLEGAAEVVKREEDGRAQGMAGPEDRVGLDRALGCVESTLVVAKVTGDPGTLQVEPAESGRRDVVALVRREARRPQPDLVVERGQERLAARGESRRRLGDNLVVCGDRRGGRCRAALRTERDGEIGDGDDRHAGRGKRERTDAGPVKCRSERGHRIVPRGRPAGGPEATRRHRSVSGGCRGTGTTTGSRRAARRSRSGFRPG